MRTIRSLGCMLIGSIDKAMFIKVDLKQKIPVSNLACEWECNSKD